MDMKEAIINKLDELAEETLDNPSDFNAGILYAIEEIWNLIQGKENE